MTAEEFIAKWSKVDLTERSAAQAHFLDLCELVGQSVQRVGRRCLVALK